ncbi:MAG TPA: PHB depolymerase family esterase [Acidimicrobiia bacterium]|nr:PHB depolymerase family esterase [Acidimicrobiia bacterium]
MSACLLVAVGLTLAAPTVAPAATGASPAPHSAGCGAAVPASNTVQEIQSVGGPRTYRLAVPPNTGQRALPLILNFHGYGSNAGAQAIYSQLETKGPQRGYVIVTPQGTATPAFWNILPGLAAPDDVAYTNALIDHTEQTLCIDPTRVYATGISNGAGMSALLGCRIPGRLAAIAPVAGVNLVRSCPTGTPLPVVAFHGTTDPVVGYHGGHSTFTQLPVLDVPTSVAAWAARDRCAAKPTKHRVTPHVELTDYTGCRAGTAVELYSVVGGGHTWPGAIDVPSLGPTTHEIDATDLILAFFARHARPGVT